MNPLHKVRWWWAGDRVVKVAITNSTVMGQSAVLCLATIIGWIGILQVLGGLGSHIITQWGGFQLDTAWATCLVGAGIMIWMAWFRRYKYDSAYWEMGGIALIEVGLGFYIFAIFFVADPANAGLAIGLCLAAGINCAGRAWLLWRRLRELRRGLL